MATNAKILETVVSISGAIDPSLRKSLLTAQKELKKTNMAALAGKAAMVAAAAAVVKYSVQAVKQAASYQKQLSNIGTLLDGDIKGRLASMSKEIIDVSNSTGQATEDLTNGMYQVVSAFGDTADASKQLEIAAKAAKAGNATTTDSINLLSAVTKGYGDTSAAAQQKAADLAFVTVKLGQTTFPELAASMGKVIPLAATLGVEQEQLMGAMATLTGVTGGTAEVTTQLKATMQSFLQPSDQMTASVEKLGYANAAAMLDSEGLQGTLDLLKESVGGNDIAFSGLFSSVEAKTAVLAMAGAQAADLTKKTQAMYQATGAADAAFAAQTDNLEDRWAMLQNLGTNALTQIGMEALPFLEEAVDVLLPALKDILPDIVQAVGGIFKAFAPLFPILAELVKDLLPIAVKLIEIIARGWIVLLTALMPIIDVVLQLVSDLLPSLMPFLDLVLAILKPIMELLEPIAEVVSIIVGWIAKVVEWVVSGLTWVIELFTGGDKSNEVAQTAKMAGYAVGGITDGLGVVGEDPAYPREFVISSNPAFKSSNIGYWTEAGKMLGLLDPDSAYGGSSTSVVYDFGGLTFAPVIYADKNTDTEDIMQKLKAAWPEFVDEFVDEIDKREEGNYVRRGDRVF